MKVTIEEKAMEHLPCGFAAAQCGKPTAFRCSPKRPEAQPQKNY